MQQPHDTQRLPAYEHPADPHGEHPTERFAPVSEPGSASPEAGRRRLGTGALVGLGVLALVVVLVVGLIGLELGLRKSVGDRLRQEASASLGSPAHVELGPRPVLLSVFDDTLGSVRITTDGAPADAAGEPAPAIDLTAEGLREEGNVTRIRSLSGTAFVSDQTMAATAQQESAGSLLGGLVQVQSVVSDAASGTLRVSLGLAEAELTPRIGPNGHLQLDPGQATVLGFPLPAGLLGGTVSMMDSALADLPEGARLTGARVVDGGMVLDISGQDVVLEPTS